MIGKINKKILLLAVVALLAISAACLLANPRKTGKSGRNNLDSDIYSRERLFGDKKDNGSAFGNGSERFGYFGYSEYI